MSFAWMQNILKTKLFENDFEALNSITTFSNDSTSLSDLEKYSFLLFSSDLLFVEPDFDIFLDVRSNRFQCVVNPS